MTFNEFLKTHKVNGYALCDDNGPHYLSDEEIQLLADVWNAAIESVLRDLQSKVHINTYNVTTIDYDEATRVCTRLLSKSS